MTLLFFMKPHVPGEEQPTAQKVTRILVSPNLPLVLPDDDDDDA